MRDSKKLLFAVVSGFALAAALPAFAEEVVGMTDLVAPEAPGTHVFTFIIVAQPGEEFAQHSHGGTGMVLMLEGEATITWPNGDSLVIKVGDMFTEMAGDVHGAKVSDAGPAKFLWTLVLPDGAEMEIPFSG